MYLLAGGFPLFLPHFPLSWKVGITSEFTELSIPGAQLGKWHVVGLVNVTLSSMYSLFLPVCLFIDYQLCTTIFSQEQD